MQLLVFGVLFQLPEVIDRFLRGLDLVPNMFHQEVDGAGDDLLFVRDSLRGRPAEQSSSLRVVFVALHERICVAVMVNQIPVAQISRTGEFDFDIVLLKVASLW